jgi:hypothetical protein
VNPKAHVYEYALEPGTLKAAIAATLARYPILAGRRARARERERERERNFERKRPQI